MFGGVRGTTENLPAKKKKKKANWGGGGLGKLGSDLGGDFKTLHE